MPSATTLRPKLRPIENGPHDSNVAGAGTHSTYKALIDLQCRKRIPLEDAAPGIAGAVIIERNADAYSAKLLQDTHDSRVVPQQNVFGDLKLQCVRRKGRRRKSFLDDMEEVTRAKLSAKEIDSDAVVRMSSCARFSSMAASGADNPLSYSTG